MIPTEVPSFMVYEQIHRSGITRWKRYGILPDPPLIPPREVLNGLKTEEEAIFIKHWMEEKCARRFKF